MKRIVIDELKQVPLRHLVCRECGDHFDGRGGSLCSTCQGELDLKLAAENEQAMAILRERERAERTEKRTRRRTEYRELLDDYDKWKKERGLT